MTFELNRTRINKEHGRTEVNFNWSEVKERYLEFVGHKGEWETWNSQRSMERLRSGTWSDTGWVGNSTDEMKGFLKDGYSPKELALIEAYTPKVLKPKPYNSEEGDEIHFDRAWSGDPTPFVKFEDRPSKPGLRIVADCCFHCGTPASLIGEYGAWLAGLMRGLEIQGYDLELDILYSFSGLFEGERAHGPNSEPFTDINIRVTDEGEWSDFAEFSALFAPGGFRTLGFTTTGMAGDLLDKRVTDHIGYPNGNAWEARFEEVTRTLTIVTPNGGRTFPAEKLSEQVKTAGLIK